MRNALVALAVIGVVAASANGVVLRLFFSETDEVGAAPPPEWVAEENLAVSEPGTFYLWADVAEPAVWNQLSLGLESEATGNGSMYMPQWFGGLFKRWNAVSDNLGDLAGTDPYNLVSVTEQGLRNPANGVDDQAIVVGSHVLYLLGEITFTGVGVGDGLFVSVGPEGIARQGGDPSSDRVHFGFGDAGLRGDDAGNSSEVADIVFAPEPASLLLLALGVLVMRSRRR